MDWLKKIHFSTYWIFLAIGVICFMNVSIILDAALWSKFTGIAVLIGIGGFYLRTKNISFLTFKPLIFIALPGFILLSLVSAFLAINTSESFSFFARSLLYFLFFVVSYSLFLKGEYKLNLSRAASLMVLFSIVYACWQIKDLSVFNDYHQNSYLITSFFANRNLFTEVMVLSLAFAIFGIMYDSKFWRFVHAFAIFFILVVTVFLMVRSAWIALFVFCFIFVFLLFRNGLEKIISKKIINISIVVIVSIILSFVLIIKFIPSIHQTFSKQTYWVKNPDFGSSKERFELWKTCIPMIKENPILGVGPANWKLEYPRYHAAEIREVKNGIYTQFQRVHNDYLQILTENGIPAFLLIFISVLLVLYYSFKILKKKEDKSLQVWTILMLSSLGAYLVFSFFSFPMERTEESVLILLAIASMVVEYSKLTHSEVVDGSKKQNLIANFIILSSCFCLIVGFYRMKGEYYTYKLFKEREVNNHSAVIDYSEKVKNPFYKMDPAGVPIAFYEGAAYFTMGDLPHALTSYEESYALFPFHKQTLNDLASCYIVNDQQDKGIEFYKKTLLVSPKFDDALVNLAIVYFKKGNLDSSYFYISKCDTLSKQQNYQKVVNALNSATILQLQQKAQDLPLVLSKINDIACNQNWQWSIFKHSIESGKSLKDRYIIEILYSLHEVDKKISKEESTQIEYTLNQ